MNVLCFTNFHFCKQEINRVAENDFEVVYSSRIVMTGFNKPQSDFIYVNCNNFAGISIYDNFHASVQRHPSVRKFKVRSLLIAVVKLYMNSLVKQQSRYLDCHLVLIGQLC